MYNNERVTNKLYVKRDFMKIKYKNLHCDVNFVNERLIKLIKIIQTTESLVLRKLFCLRS